MLRLFKIEWLKVKSYRTFWVLFLGFVIFFPAAFYFFAYKYMGALEVTGSLDEEILKRMLGAPFVFPKVWQASGFIGGICFIVIGMLFVMMITNEVQYRTHRQNIIDGWSRLDFLKAKFTMMLFFVFVSTLLVAIMGLIVGLVFSPSAVDLIEGLHYVGYFMLMAVLYLMFAFFIAILVKRTGLAIIIYVSAIVVDNIIWAICTFNDTQIGFFLPLEAADSLLGNPFKPKLLEKRTVPDLALIVAALTYITAYGYVIINYFRKTDLKT